ncbi:unnamed protein product [Dicrocoelium dendriticum]|nr:unnamed protein product [Dicrocoelium dendriticum]
MPVTVDLAIESLPPEVQAKAERELNEVLQFRQDAIDALKNLIRQEDSSAQVIPRSHTYHPQLLSTK